MSKLYFRSYECEGKKEEAEVMADDDDDAYSEFDHWENGFCQGHPERYETFEWTGPPYTRD